MEAVATAGMSELMKQGAAIVVLLLVIMGLCVFIRMLLLDAKEERKLNREALEKNTSVLARFEELLRMSLRN